MVEAVDKPEAELRNARLAGDEAKRLSAQLYYMLALSIDPDTTALARVKNAGETEGFVAWQRLVRLYEPDTAGRAAALLQE
eukprot:9904222-Lingulodinium_polyedra.AAC.1